MEIFAKLADNGLSGCRVVVVVLRVKMGPFLGCFVRGSERPDGLAGVV